MPNVNQGLPIISSVPTGSTPSENPQNQVQSTGTQSVSPVSPVPIAPSQNVQATPTLIPSSPQQPAFVESIGEQTTPPPPATPLPLSLARWGTVLMLTAIGTKGFLDALYFNTVEFQNFEKAFEEHLVETQLINQLILKAVLLIVSTALSVFFAMQLSVFSRKGPHWLRVIFSLIIAIICIFVLQYASTIHVVDVLR